MATSLYLSRDTKMFVKLPAAFSESDNIRIFEIPILEGFSVSQTDNSVEITANEAVTVKTSSIGNLTRRGMSKIKSSTNPAEFSFQTYVRPFTTGNGGATMDTGVSTVGSKDTALEMVLWALFSSCSHLANDGTYKNEVALSSGTANQTVITPGTSNTSIDLNHAKLVRGFSDAEFIFQVAEMDDDTFTKFTVTGAVLNEATVDFDIEGIATINWSGMGKGLTVTSDATTEVATVYEGIVLGTPTDGPVASFIQNKIGSLEIDPNAITAADALNTGYTTLNSGNAYTVTLTGGSITLNNNITYLTPENLHMINEPCNHVLGTLQITGNVTCYMDGDSNGTLQLFTDLLGSENFTEDFTLKLHVGDHDNGPALSFEMDHAHLDVPTTNFDEIVSLDVSFTALGDARSLSVPPAVKLIYKAT